MSMDPNVIKLVVLGCGGVGKSAITVKFVQGFFIQIYDPTIEDSYRKQMMIGSKSYVVEILDTSGSEQFTSMRDLYIKNADGIIMVFDITNEASLHDLDKIHNQITIIRENENVPILICANKSDMPEYAQISPQIYYDISRRFGGLLFETSAKTGYNIQESFMSLLNTIVEHRKNMIVPKKRKKCEIL